MDNISIEIRRSLFDDNESIGNYTDQVSSYSHVISASGGYKSAGFTLTGDQLDLEDWFEYGLGRDVVVYDEGHQEIWNGFVNKVSVTIGGRTLERGPLMDVVNRLQVAYTPLDTSVVPPVRGTASLTALAQSSASQAKYGILADIFSAGDATDANAATIRDTLLAERDDPEMSETLSLDSGGLSATIDCLGYCSYLEVYPYSNLTGSGTVGASTKIATIMNANPNAGIISTNYNKVTVNALPVPAFEDGKKNALEIILGEVAKGDSSNNRYTFGIYQNRQSIYGPIPTSFAYEFRLSSSKLGRYGGGEIYPWEVLPARWLFYTDFLVGRSQSASMREDPRALFIETVTFTAPWGLSLNGGKVRTSPQLLARLGLGGAT
jgi:hypothetical protein